MANESSAVRLQGGELSTEGQVMSIEMAAWSSYNLYSNNHGAATERAKILRAQGYQGDRSGLLSARSRATRSRI